jgi:hypothetical protein
MKRSLRFMVAKYTPDLHRMEPRNIGIILWADSGATVARFMGEQSDGSVRVPSLVEKNDRHAFREWHTYWRHQMSAEGISRRSGEIVDRSSPQFLEALREKSKEQFRLVDGGTFSETISEREMERALGELYDRIVEPPEKQLFRAERLALSDACANVFKTSGVVDRPDFLHDLPVPRYVHSVLRTFVADYAIGPVGQPRAVLQRVLLSRSQSIDSNAFMFDTLINRSDKPINRVNCAALVHLGQPLDNNAEEGIKLLGALVSVIDVSKAHSIKEIEAIALRTVASPN